MKSQKKSSLVLLAVIGILVPGAAFAESAIVYPDKAAVTITDKVNTITIPVVQNHSYCCEARAANFSDSYSFDVFKNMDGELPEVYERDIEGWNPPAITSFNSPRTCFAADDNFVITPAARVSVSLVRDDASSAPLTVECSDTTLVGGYNTFSSDYLFLELVNTGGATDVDAIVLLEDSSGVTSRQSVSVSTRTDVSIKELALSQRIGKISIIHNGSPNQLKAWLAEYRVDTAGLQSSFSLVGRSRLETITAK
ncbi:MAG: hypothetical protein KDD69_05205 [Bdellovibrionales bacterium]|nr:hypothetical protein [Bdellovibrionales bacterium]